MRYEDMPKGRNKDRCVRCGKRYNFADKALSKAKVPYDLLCLAEVTTSGYMTHGNVKLCDECMVELLMWLDRKPESNSEKPNNCEDLQDWKDRMWAEAIVTEPTISKMEQVDKDINVRSKTEPQTDIPKSTLRTDCNGCKFVGTYDTEFPCANCSRKTKDYYTKDEQTDCPWK